MHCTSWVNCDELLSAGKYHLYIAEQIWIYPTQGKCFGQTCKTFWILNKTQSKPLSSFCMLVLWRRNCVLGYISLLSSKVAVAFEGLDFSDEKFNHSWSWSLSWSGPVQVFDGWHEICRRAPLKNTCLTMKLGVRQLRTVTLLFFNLRKNIWYNLIDWTFSRRLLNHLELYFFHRYHCQQLTVLQSWYLHLKAGITELKLRSTGDL